MEIYHISYETKSDYDSIRKNGLWYLEWQSGYSDILKKGYQKPKNKNTILAELYSIETEDFLHSPGTDTPFILSDRAYKLLKKNQISGIKYTPVEIVKITSKNKKHTKSNSNEPEDQILNKNNKIDKNNYPVLHGAKIIGQVDISPDFTSGRTESGYVSPFELKNDFNNYPDLWNPTLNGEIIARYLFCSLKFKALVENNNLTNIVFIPFDKFMKKFRTK